MNRIGLAFTAFALTLALGVGTASAQYPDPNRPDAVGSGTFVPGGQGNLTVTGAAPGSEEPGTITSTPIPVNDTADANGILN
jgi:LPXTG-motif cell wall-anchored protein